MSERLKFLDSLLYRNLGHVLEGDTFSFLKLSPYALRSWEFALSDGAIDCSSKHRPESPFVERLHVVLSLPPHESRKVLLGESKSASSSVSGTQAWCCTLGQRRRVAFFLGRSPADRSFVELMPNLRQDPEALESSAQEAENETLIESVNVTRISRLFDSAHGNLSPCGSPFRMPVCLLPAAIRRARRHAQGLETYVNPWTGVIMPEWKPAMTQLTRWIVPAEGNDHFTAFEEAMLIYEAYFSLSLPESPRKYYIQHKIDGQIRALNTPLTKVKVKRSDRHYFDSLDRFDFLYFSFAFTKDATVKKILFIPERKIPEEWFSSQSDNADFTIEDLQPYFIDTTEGWQWLHQVAEIIRSNPEPRTPGGRRARESAKPRASRDPKRKRLVGQQVEGQSKRRKKGEMGDSGTAQRGARAAHAHAMRCSHRSFFYETMEECARRRSGLIVELSNNEESGDFGFGRYTWSDKEYDEFVVRGRIPRTRDSLPACMSLVSVIVNARQRECDYTGPKMLPTEYRRLNATTAGRLIIWDLGGIDTSGQPTYAVTPSEDIAPTAQQQIILQNALKAKDRWPEQVPSVNALLNKRLLLPEYCVTNGPLVWESRPAAGIWELLDSFASFDVVSHPRGHPRSTSTYRHTIQEINQRLACHLFRQMDVGEAIQGGSEEALSDVEEGGEEEEEEEFLAVV